MLKFILHRKLQKQILLCLENSFLALLSLAMILLNMRETSRTWTGLAKTLKSCLKMGS